jgi:hypothetical protein
MESHIQDEKLWADLEIAVRTPVKDLPVDVFLPDPGEEVSRLMQERSQKKKASSVQEHPGTIASEESFHEIEETRIADPERPVVESTNIEDELRSKFEGDSFAELEDV